jgi:hypothetical protein
MGCRLVASRTFATATNPGPGELQFGPDSLAVAFWKLVGISPYEFLTEKINFASRS